MIIIGNLIGTWLSSFIQHQLCGVSLINVKRCSLLPSLSCRIFSFLIPFYYLLHRKCNNTYKIAHLYFAWFHMHFSSGSQLGSLYLWNIIYHAEGIMQKFIRKLSYKLWTFVSEVW